MSIFISVYSQNARISNASKNKPRKISKKYIIANNDDVTLLQNFEMEIYIIHPEISFNAKDHS